MYFVREAGVLHSVVWLDSMRIPMNLRALQLNTPLALKSVPVDFVSGDGNALSQQEPTVIMYPPTSISLHKAAIQLQAQHSTLYQSNCFTWTIWRSFKIKVWVQLLQQNKEFICLSLILFVYERKSDWCLRDSPNWVSQNWQLEWPKYSEQI